MGKLGQRALASLGASLGMLAPQVLHALLDEYGPSSRFVFHPYLPSPSYHAIMLAGGAVGASLGAEVALVFRENVQGYSVVRVACGCLAGSWLAAVPGMLAAVAIAPQATGFSPPAMATFFSVTGLGGWAGGALLFKSTGAAARKRRPPWARLAALAIVGAAMVGAQLRPFPSSGTAAEREAWARAHVRPYPGLARIISASPQVVGDVGRVVTIAPTARDRQSYGSTMNGDDVRFTLDVIGERGAGVFFADGTIEGDWVVDWRSGTWSFGGKTVPVDPRPTP